MKIAIVVHGRFHAFDLARALIHRGNNVTLFTNYPGWAVERFGISRIYVRSFWPHGVVSRLALKLSQQMRLAYPSPLFYVLFGRWAASQLINEDWDIVHCWSGIAEEVFLRLDQTSALKFVVRGSTHIRTQAHLLQEEEERTGISLDRPSPWIVAREEREYNLSDRIITISTFSRNSFIDQGIPPQKAGTIIANASARSFRPEPRVIEARCQRILSGVPLRIINVGTLSLRKGMWDMATIIQTLDKANVTFCFVGPLTSEVLDLVNNLKDKATFIIKQSQSYLPAFYAWGDVFVLPTIEDGFPAVLRQAAAAALPILTTPNGAGNDLICDDVTGWILPIRTPEAFIERLRWCDAHRTELAEMVWRMYHEYQPRDWNDVAADFERICDDALTRMA